MSLMLTVHQGNRLELLADRLATLLRTPTDDPLAAEVIVVQNLGMARWVAMHLARRLGVCANTAFRLPADFVWDVVRRVLPDVADQAAFEPATMAWRLMALLEGLDDGPRFAPLRAYLAGGDPLARFELARRIADTFDQYLVYRPDWVLGWEQGTGDHWQAELWRRLAAHGPRPHRAQLQAALARALDAGVVARAGLPRRLALFGIPAMAPATLGVFGGLAAHLDVHLFLLNPCQKHWGDIVAERDLPRRAGERDPAELYLETGNALLASLGKQGAEFIDLVQDLGPRHEIDCWAPPAEDSLLGRLQADVLALRERGRDLPAVALGPGDRSVQVHACHSPMREVEVLHDQLLALFASDRDLRPSDVVVMMPDVETYAPCIEAVFATAPPERRIPFTIADRTLRAESSLMAAFLALLELPDGRYEATRLLALLETPAVLRRFGLERSDLELVHRWVRDSGVRWGADAEARARLGLPAVGEHSWRFGLDRLLLGWAQPGEAARLSFGILPYDDVEGTSAGTLGRLASFIEAACALERELAMPRSVPAWVDTLTQVLARFVDAGDDEEDDAQAVRAALGALAGSACLAGFDAPVPREIVVGELRRALEMPAASGRFLAGGVTFCAMVPMRSIPFSVVCLLGMDIGRFPRTRRPVGFDLMPEQPRLGDRSRRDDDRWLFLEALLSARRCLYLSYVGRSIRDNTDVPPSVLVSELLDAIRRATGASPAELVTFHPLQSFSRAYFRDDPWLFSFSSELCDASRALRRPGGSSVRLVREPLPEADPEWRTVPLERLLRFAVHPVRFFLRERLGIRLEAGEEVIETREPFTVGGLERYELRQRLLALHLGEQTPEATLAILRAGGVLPHGAMGAAVFRRQRIDVEAFAERVRDATATQRPPLAVDLAIDDFRLTGTLEGVAASGLVDYRLANTTPRDLLAIWIRHLVLHLAAPPATARRSLWIGLEDDVVLRPVADATAHLRILLRCYWEGLRRPLPLLPRCAHAYVQATNDPLAAALDAWVGNEYAPVPGERDDVHNELAFRDTGPLDAEFERLAREVFGAILAHCEKAA